MILVNPIYDTAFKYLMDDKKSATILLSALLRKKVLDLDMRHCEYSLPNEDEIRLFRLDFSARIQDENGAEELVSIELQKAQLASEVARFRRYLAVQYNSDDNVDKNGRPLHIVAIYLLGHKVTEFDSPVVYVDPTYSDANNEALRMSDNEENYFVRSLHHDVIVVQIPLLSERPRSHVEKILSVFDQRYRLKSDSRFINYEAEDETAELRTIVKRLLSGAADDQLRGNMDFETDYNMDQEESIKIREERDFYRGRFEDKCKEAEESRKEAEESRKDAEEARRREDEANKKAEEANKREEVAALENLKLKVAMARTLRDMGLSEGEIATKLGVSVDEVRELLR